MSPARALLPLAFALSASTACGPKRPPAPGIPASLSAVAPVPSTVEYVRVALAGPLPLPDTRLRETWVGPSLIEGRVVYDVTTEDLTEPDHPRRVEVVRIGFDAAGMSFLGTVDEAGALEAWVPPQLALPAAPVVGATWAGTHQKGEASSERSCEILASDYCEGGLVAVCDSRRGGGAVVLRDHYCPGVGWAGFEALAQTGGGAPSMRMWSESLLRDGQRVAFTFVEEEPAEAPVPTPEEAP